LAGAKGEELKAAADVHPRVGYQPKTGALEATWRSPTYLQPLTVAEPAS
jgi:hypothetical protein